MKKYILIFASTLLLATFSACHIEQENLNKPSKNKFWKTEQDARYGTNAIYNMFYKPGTFSRWMWFRLDLTSDEGFSQSPWAELKEWTQFNYTNYNFWDGNAWTYRDCYEAIFRANQVLAYVPNISFQNETEKTQLLGQAYFLRGLYNYYLALLWGTDAKSLAINLEPSTPQMRPQGHTGTEVYQQAINDFTQAMDMLPLEWGGENEGRATKGAAYGFRAKAYMQIHKWEEAKSDLKWFVEGEGKTFYDLTANYFDNFNKDTENNKESVFEIQFSDVNKAPAGDGDFDMTPNLGLNRGQFFAPPGIGWTDGELRPWLVDEFKKEKDSKGGYDIRLRYTAFYEGMEKDFANNDKMYSKPSNAETWAEGSYNGRVFFRKYSAEYFRDFDDYYNPTNVRLIRFSDILLMYAECIVQSGGSVTDAATHVDRVRARVSMPAMATNHAAALANRDVFLKRLQMERVLELSTEGHRWADIKRWGLTDTQAGLDELKSRDADFNNFQIGKHSSLPIPSSEVKNNVNIEQNTNY